MNDRAPRRSIQVAAAVVLNAPGHHAQQQRILPGEWRGVHAHGAGALESAIFGYLLHCHHYVLSRDTVMAQIVDDGTDVMMQIRFAIRRKAGVPSDGREPIVR